MIGVGVLEKCDQALNDVAGIQSGDPVVLNGLCADLAGVLLDVWVEDLGLEVNLWGLEWIVVREVDVHDELASLERCVSWPDDCSVPVGQVVSDQIDVYALNWVAVVKVRQLLFTNGSSSELVFGYLLTLFRRPLAFIIFLRNF